MPILHAIVLIPVTNVIFWVVLATIIDMVTGGITLLVLRNRSIV